MSDQKDRWFPEVNSGGLVVGRFRYNESLPDVAASKAADKEIKRKLIVLESKAVASSDVSVQIVKPHNEREFRTRFPDAWRAFQGEEVKISGTPLKEMGIFSDDQILFLQLNGILSIEQLAALDDAKCGHLGFGWRNNREKAKAHLGKRVDIARREDLRVLIAETVGQGGSVAVEPPLEKTAEDIEAEIAALQAKLAEKRSAVSEKPAEEMPKRRPGRPRKAEPEAADAA